MKFVVSVSRQSSAKWHACVPELPGCAADGASAEDVTRKIDRAIRSYLASMDVPPPDEIEEVVEVCAGGTPAPLAYRRG